MDDLTLERYPEFDERSLYVPRRGRPQRPWPLSTPEQQAERRRVLEEFGDDGETSAA